MGPNLNLFPESVMPPLRILMASTFVVVIAAQFAMVPTAFA